MGSTVLSKRGRGRPLKDAHRPNCPRHPNSRVQLDGHFRRWSNHYERPRYRCVSQPGTRGHAFSLPRPVRRPTHGHPDTGGSCPECEHDYERHEGFRTGRNFLFAINEIANLLSHVGHGGSLRGASRSRREDIHREVRRQWRHIGPGQTSKEAHLATNYVDAYADVVLEALAPREWPRVAAIDSMPLRTRGYRDGKKVGDLNAGEIMVAIDHTARDSKPCLIQVQGGKDHQSWLDFFSTLSGEPEWIVADLDRGIAKAVHMKWPNAVLFHSRDHLQRLMEDYAVLDGVERAVRITDPAKLQKPKRAMWPWNQRIQDFEPHPLFDAITTCQRGPAEWEAFKQLVDQYIPHHRTELRSWMATNEPLVQVQWLQVADHHRMPVGSGSVEGKIREFLGTWLKPRAGRYQNARRLNKILGLMMLRLRGEARRGRFVTILREHFHANHQFSGVRDWHAWEDRGGRSSLAKLVHDANLRQRAEQRRDEIRRGAILRLRRWQDEEMRRKVLGLPPLRAGHRWTPGKKTKHRGVRGKFISDFPDLMREWDYTLNWATHPSEVRGTAETRVFWRCRHDPGHVWDTRVTDRATHIRGCPYCMGQRVHPKDSLAAHSPALAEEWHPTKNGALTSDQVTAGSGRKVWWKDPNGHVWQAPVFSRAKNLANCQRCFVASQTKRPKKARSRTSN